MPTTTKDQSTQTHVQYRAECRAPGERRWRFVAFTGAGPSISRARVEQGIQWAQETSPRAYEYRVTERTVTTTTTPWRIA